MNNQYLTVARPPAYRGPTPGVLRFMLTDTPIVKNLNNPEYLEIILDGCRTLEERFERIDSRLVAQKLKAEQRKHQIIGAEMKKIIKLPDLPERLSVLLAH